MIRESGNARPPQVEQDSLVHGLHGHALFGVEAQVWCQLGRFRDGRGVTEGWSDGPTGGSFAMLDVAVGEKAAFCRGARRSLLGNSSFAHAFEEGLKLDQIRRVVGHSRPSGAGPRDGEGRVERKTGLDCGMRLVKATKLREAGG
jgi:hypothetical protein